MFYASDCSCYTMLDHTGNYSKFVLCFNNCACHKPVPFIVHASHQLESSFPTTPPLLDVHVVHVHSKVQRRYESDSTHKKIKRCFLILEKTSFFACSAVDGVTCNRKPPMSFFSCFCRGKSMMQSAWFVPVFKTLAIPVAGVLMRSCNCSASNLRYMWSFGGVAGFFQPFIHTV